MRTIKKILAAMVCVCMLVPCVTFVAYAANGRISFSDPSTAVGDMVDVKCVINSTSGSLGDTSVTFSYDSSALRFDSGDGVSSSGDGTLTYSSSGGSSEITFTMTFQALTEGETKITISDQDINSSSGSALTMDEGSSAIQIAEGDPSKITQTTEETASGEGMTVEVNGQSYQLNGDFADVDIPVGFTRTTMVYEGAERPMVVQDTSGVYLAYLTSTEGESDFYVFDEENGVFFPYEQIDISDTVSIILFSDDSLQLPSNYVLTTLTLNGDDFPVWQDTDQDGFYLMYAVNDSGEKGFYQYDSQENTYQRITVSAEEMAEEKEAGNSIFDKLQSLVDGHFKLFTILAGVIFLVLLIAFIVTRVKLRNRDIELDDLYDEYGIDLEDEPEPKNKKGAKNQPAVKKTSRRAADEDDFEEAKEAPLRTVKFDDFNTITDMGLDGFDDDYGVGGYDYDDSEDMIDDLDELLSKRPEKKRSHAEKDDAFQVDFIDLD